MSSIFVDELIRQRVIPFLCKSDTLKILQTAMLYL
jgi:hypothetical protein